MGCSEIRALLQLGRKPVGDAATTHLKSCEACRDLVEASGDLFSLLGPRKETKGPTTDLDDLWKRIESDVVEERGLLPWLRAQSIGTRVAVIVIVALFTAIAMQYAVNGTFAFPRTMNTRLLISLTACTVMFWLLMQRAYRSLYSPEGAPRVAIALVVSGILLPFALAFLSSHDHIAQVAAREAPTLSCFVLGMIASLPPLIAAYAMNRFQPPRGAIVLCAAAAAALTGVSFLEVHCVFSGPDKLAHLLLGHATVATAFVALHAAISAWLGVRSSS